MAKAKTARCRLLAIPIARELARDPVVRESTPKEGFPLVKESQWREDPR